MSESKLMPVSLPHVHLGFEKDSPISGESFRKQALNGGGTLNTSGSEYYLATREYMERVRLIYEKYVNSIFKDNPELYFIEEFRAGDHFTNDDDGIVYFNGAVTLDIVSFYEFVKRHRESMAYIHSLLFKCKEVPCCDFTCLWDFFDIAIACIIHCYGVKKRDAIIDDCRDAWNECFSSLIKKEECDE